MADGNDASNRERAKEAVLDMGYKFFRSLHSFVGPQ